MVDLPHAVTNTNYCQHLQETFSLTYTVNITLQRLASMQIQSQAEGYWLSGIVGFVRLSVSSYRVELPCSQCLGKP